MKKLLVLLVPALAVAGLISYQWQPVSFEDRAIGLELDQAPPALAEALREQPVEIKALVLDYQDDKLLLLKAQAALLKYPQLAVDVFPLYGDKPEFKEILATHGEAILPPIHYFLKNDVTSVRLAHYLGQKTQEIKGSAQRLIGAEKKKTQPPPEPEPEEKALTAEQRGWYAVSFIKSEGHDFLGQFVMNGEGKPKWIQSERVLEGASALFTGGIRNVETRFQSDQALSAEDYGWAAVDAFAAMGAVKLLRISRAASASGESVNASTRAAALTSRLARTSQLGAAIARYGKWPAIAVAAYIALRHPDIISDVLAQLANFFDLPTWAGLLAGWTLIVLAGLYVTTWIVRLVLRPLIWLMNTIQWTFAWLEPIQLPKMRRSARWDNWQVGRS